MVTGVEIYGMAKSVAPGLIGQVKKLLDSKRAKAEQLRRTELATEIGRVIVQTILAGGSAADPRLANLVDEFERLIDNGAAPADLRHVRTVIDQSVAPTLKPWPFPTVGRPTYFGTAGRTGHVVMRGAAKRPAAKKAAAKRPAPKKAAAKRPAAKKSAAKRPAAKKAAAKRPAAKKAVRAA
jgi:hypothetical protein